MFVRSQFTGVCLLVLTTNYVTRKFYGTDYLNGVLILLLLNC